MIPADLDDIATHRTADLGGFRMHYVEAGAGPLVLLLHGFPEMWWSWRHQIRALAEAGFRVVVPDQRGYNETDKQGPYDLDTLVGDIGKLIGSLGAGPKARIVGHDWGGAVSWHIASTRADLVERLAVMNCPHPLIMKKRIFQPRQLRRSWYMFAIQLPWLADGYLTRNDAANLNRVLRASVTNKTHYSDEELRPFRDAIQKPGAVQGMLGWYRAMPKQMLNPPKISPVEAETMLLWGMDDPALDFQDLVPGTERWVPKLKIVRVEGAGHFVQSDQPASVNKALIDFLS